MVLRLFDLGIFPATAYGIEIIWENFLCANLEFFIAKNLFSNVTALNRLIIQRYVAARYAMCASTVEYVPFQNEKNIRCEEQCNRFTRLSMWLCFDYLQETLLLIFSELSTRTCSCEKLLLYDHTT